MPGTENPADIMTKSLPHHKARVFTDPLLFWKGETSKDDMTIDDESEWTIVEGPSQAKPEGSDKRV